jgi:hypothetical protein
VATKAVTGSFCILDTEIFDLFREMQARAFTSVRSSSDYGTVAVFEDLYGNPWDLLQLTPEPILPV